MKEICSQCRERIPEGPKPGTGYAKTPDGLKICYACCGRNDKANLLQMKVGDRTALYLISEPSEKWPYRQFYVTNWPSSLKIPVGAPNDYSRHNIAGKRYDVWFLLEGAFFHGVQYGVNTQICHIQRTKRPRR